MNNESHPPRTSPRPLVLFCGGGSGGHLTPGLAVADVLAAAPDPCDVRFVTGDRPVETRVFADEPYDRIVFPLAPPAASLRSPRRAAAWVRAFRHVRRAVRGRNACVVGLGGYASLPGVLAAKAAGVPVVLLEQNVIPGRATRLLCRAADVVAVSFPDTAGHLPGGTPIAVTGNPVRVPAGRRGDGRSILVLGGSQGSAAVDAAVPAALAAADLRRPVTHQCAGDPRPVAARYAHAGINAEVAPFFDDVPRRLAGATLLIGRAGATTLAEAAACGVPAVLIPHPRVPGDHQTANARWYAGRGAAWVVPEGDGLADRLTSRLRTLGENPTALDRAAAAMAAAGRPDAAKSVAAIVRDRLAAGGRVRGRRAAVRWAA